MDERLRNDVLESLRQDLHSINVESRSQLTSLCHDLTLITGERVSVGCPPLNLEQFWQELRGSVKIELAEEVRLKRLGVMGVLAKTRQKVFMVLMVTMLLPRLGLDKFIQVPPSLANVLAIAGGIFFCLLSGGRSAGSGNTTPPPARVGDE